MRTTYMIKLDNVISDDFSLLLCNWKKKGRENWKWFFPVYINFTLDGFIHHDDSICEIWVGIHLFRSHTLSCYNYMADNATNKQSDPIISSMHNKVTRKLKSIKICEAWKKSQKCHNLKAFFSIIFYVCACVWVCVVREGGWYLMNSGVFNEILEPFLSVRFN